MEQRLTPEFFCGSAVAALAGILFGMALHVPWQKHPGGPQILSRPPELAAAADPSADSPPAPAASPTELADLDTTHVRPDPLPVTRLHPEMFNVQPAAAGEAERQDADDLVADDAPPPLPRDLD